MEAVMILTLHRTWIKISLEVKISLGCYKDSEAIDSLVLTDILYVLKETKNLFKIVN